MKVSFNVVLQAKALDRQSPKLFQRGRGLDLRLALLKTRMMTSPLFRKLTICPYF
jgi:hypothetical protein